MNTQEDRLSELCRDLLVHIGETSTPGDGGGLHSRLVAMMSRLEFADTVNSSLELDEILDVFLLTAMGKMMTTTGVVLVQEQPGTMTVSSCRGPGAARVRGRQVRIRRPFKRPRLAPSGGPDTHCGGLAALFSDPALEPLGLALLVPLWHKDKFIGTAGFGRRLTGRPYEKSDLHYLASLASIAATAIENGLVYEEVRGLNRDLQLKILQLSSLFDVSRELVSSFYPEDILKVAVNSLVGQTAVKRCLVLTWSADGTAGVTVSLKRGLPLGQKERKQLAGVSAAPLGRLPGEHCDLAALRRLSPALTRLLSRWELDCFFPLRTSGPQRDLLAVGKKLTGQPLSGKDREFVSTLCAQAVTAMENAQLHTQMVEKERLEKELSIARNIQKSLLPGSVPVVQGLELAQTSMPCYEVGGDYHDYIECGEGRLGLVVGDVTGKSTPAALVMASVQASLRALTMQPGLEPAVLISMINNLLFRSTEPNRFVSFFFGVLDTCTGRMEFVNAGHNPPIQIGCDGSARDLLGGGMVLGLFENAPYKSHKTVLAPGELLLLFTDGLTEANNPEGEEFGEQRLSQTAHRLRHLDAARICQGILDEVARFQQGMKPHDDLTLVVAKKE
jgi:sigma-B regulation protein RsbU (phosphoserine phosphatase)